MSSSFDGQAGIVIGIGAATAMAFAAAGASVACVDVRKAAAEETAARIEEKGGKAAPLECDVRTRRRSAPPFRPRPAGSGGWTSRTTTPAWRRWSMGTAGYA
jgi:NAD(P)-dependent dehydrogenase (short-subunit alcohol dehydrogenase family)